MCLYKSVFWCVPTFKKTIIKKLNDSNLCVQLIKLICEKDEVEYQKRLLVFAKECTFLFSLVYTTHNAINKPKEKIYKQLLFNNYCEDEREMECRLICYNIVDSPQTVFHLYSKCADMLSHILSTICEDRIHCAEIAYFIDYVIKSSLHDVKFDCGALLPSNIPYPPIEFLSEEFVL